jgi:ketosteroid isomerase-like protein
MRSFIACCTIVAIVSACSPTASESRPAGTLSATSNADSASRDSAAHKAHENYVRVINSNNLDSLMSMMTDDVIFLAANAKPVVGKAAVRAWAADYEKAFHTHWDKPVQEFTVSGDNAVERYNYTSTDTPVGGGKDVVDTGWGLVIYHRDADGVWRVSRDAFGPDHPPAK